MTPGCPGHGVRAVAGALTRKGSRLLGGTFGDAAQRTRCHQEPRLRRAPASGCRSAAAPPAAATQPRRPMPRGHRPRKPKPEHERGPPPPSCRCTVAPSSTAACARGPPLAPHAHCPRLRHRHRHGAATARPSLTGGAIIRSRAAAPPAQPDPCPPAPPPDAAPPSPTAAARRPLSLAPSTAADSAGPRHRHRLRHHSPPARRQRRTDRTPPPLRPGAATTPAPVRLPPPAVAQPLGRRVHTTVISPVTAPSPRRISIVTGNSGRSPASSSAMTSAAGRPRVAVAVTAPIASFL